MPYETEVLESAAPGTIVFDEILVTDKDTVGENLNITCMTSPSANFIGQTSPTTSDTSNLVPCTK